MSHTYKRGDAKHTSYKRGDRVKLSPDGRRIFPDLDRDHIYTITFVRDVPKHKQHLVGHHQWVSFYIHGTGLSGKLVEPV